MRRSCDSFYQAQSYLARLEEFYLSNSLSLLLQADCSQNIILAGEGEGRGQMYQRSVPPMKCGPNGTSDFIFELLFTRIIRISEISRNFVYIIELESAYIDFMIDMSSFF